MARARPLVLDPAVTDVRGEDPSNRKFRLYKTSQRELYDLAYERGSECLDILYLWVCLNKMELTDILQALFLHVTLKFSCTHQLISWKLRLQTLLFSLPPASGLHHRFPLQLLFSMEL